MLNKTTITEKLVFYFLMLNITAVLIVGLLSHINSKQAINQRTFEQLNSVKYVKKRQVENFFRDRVNEVTFLLRSEMLDFSSNSRLPEHKMNKLSDILNYYKYYKRIIIYMPDGYCYGIDSNPGGSDSSSGINIYKDIRLYPYLNKNMKDDSGKVQILELKSFSSSQPYQLFLGYTSKNRNNGYKVIFEINTDVLNSIMLETNPKEGLGTTGESYIIGKDLLMRTKSRFFSRKYITTIINTDGAINAVKGSDGTLIYRDYRNIEVLGSYGKLQIPGLDWYILAEIDLAESDQPIISNRNNILVLTLLIAAIVFLMTYFLSRKISIPIVRLTEAVRRIARGNYNEHVELKTNDEIGELMENFNYMANTLKLQEEEIEKERIKRSQAAIEAMEQERIRLSRELHDGLGQTLISQKLKLENIDFDKPEKSSKIIEDVKHSIDSTINEVRHISNDLMPAVLFEFGLLHALKKLCKDMNEFSNIEINFIPDISIDTIPDRAKIYLFRITQEALKNAFQHSNCTKCDVELISDDETIFLNIIDNGNGFDKAKVQEGNGLINIRERINLLHGDLHVISEQKKGTKLLIRIPVNGSYGKN